MKFVLGALLLSLAACSDGGRGTAVGNPGRLDMYVDAVPDGIQLRSATFEVAAIELVGCDRDVAILKIDAVFNALGPSPVEIPGGEWCSTVVLPGGEGSFMLEGVDSDGELFTLDLSPEPFVLDGAYIIDGNQVIVSLALTQAVQDLAANEATDAEPPIQGEAFEPNLVVPEGLYADEEEDGLSRGADLLASPSSANGGCSTAPAPVSALILLGMLGWLLRPRRPHRPG